jgi:hypothetical protein
MRVLAPRSNFGLGLERVITRCGQAFGHEGDFTGYRSIVYGRPDGRRRTRDGERRRDTRLLGRAAHGGRARLLFRLPASSAPAL